MRGERDEAVAVRDAVVGAFCLYCMPDGHPAVAAALDRRLPVVIVDEPRSPGTLLRRDRRRTRARGSARRTSRRSATSGSAIVADRLVDDHTEGLAGRGARRRAATARSAASGSPATSPACGPERAVPVYEAPGNFPESGARAVARAARALAARRRRCSAPPTCSPSARSRRCASCGLDVPGDVSVTGFDDVPAAAAAGLTTVRQPLHGEGTRGGPAADGARHRARGRCSRSSWSTARLDRAAAGPEAARGRSRGPCRCSAPGTSGSRRRPCRSSPGRRASASRPSRRPRGVHARGVLEQQHVVALVLLGEQRLEPGDVGSPGCPSCTARRCGRARAGGRACRAVASSPGS